MYSKPDPFPVHPGGLQLERCETVTSTATCIGACVYNGKGYTLHNFVQYNPLPPGSVQAEARTFSSSISLISLSIFLWFLSNCCSLPLRMGLGKEGLSCMYGHVRIWPSVITGSDEVGASIAEGRSQILTSCASTQQFAACSSLRQILLPFSRQV